nr:erythromycin esterase family protein [Pseudopedobacter sp.]
MLKIICLLFLTTATVYGQDSTINWLNKNCQPLKFDTTSNDDDELHFLNKLLKDKTIIGLGEASHGTREFYYQKSRIVEYLVQKEGYKMLALEAPSNIVAPINKYIQEGEGDLKSMLKSMGLYNSKEMYNLCVWLKGFNKVKSTNEKVEIIGFDSEGYWQDPFTRDELMAGSFIKKYAINKFKTILWAHNLHIAKDVTMAKYKAMGYYIKKEFGDNFYAIGFDTYKGSVNVLNNNGELESHEFAGNEDTFSTLFAKVEYPQFFIDLTKENNPLTNSVNKITNIYSNWKTPTPLPIRIGSDFDGIIFIRESSASIGLE